MKRILIVLSALIVTCHLNAKGNKKELVDIIKNDRIVQGYSKTVSGVEMNYHSSIPDIKRALIVRVNGHKPVEWESETIPTNMKSEYISIPWLAGMGINMGNAEFNLYINNQKKFTFKTTSRKQWMLKSKDGMELHFNVDYVDNAHDYFGFMVLRIPKKLAKSGKSLKLKIEGVNIGKSIWYMTFASKIESSVQFKSYPVIYKEKGKEYQTVRASMVHFGKPVLAKLKFDNKVVKKLNLKFGYNEVNLPVRKVSNSKNIVVELIKGKKLFEKKELLIKPVRPWTVYYIQHTHTDIGYTRPQTEILPEHLRYIDYALDFCDATDDYPEDAKFKWTCETTWAVDEYLKCRPQSQIDRLIKRAKEGRIEVAGMYLNYTEIPDESLLAHSLQPVKRIREAGIPVVSAMQNDVNGIAWCMNDYFNSLGIKYLDMGTHGHRALICFDKPTLFWWESPSGNRMLAYRSEHYMTGTIQGLTNPDTKVLEPNLLNYLEDLGSKGYKYNSVGIQYSGYHTDNAPPSTFSSETIKKWNKKYVWPKLKNATVSEFIKDMEKKHAEEFPVYKAAWPDWWTDGAASAMRELSAARKTQTDMIANQAALSMATLSGYKLKKDIFKNADNVQKSLNFYEEHTYGAAESVREPYCDNSMVQRAEKESYVWNAVKGSRMLKESALGLLQTSIKKSDVPTLVIYNTMAYKRSGIHIAYIDQQIIPKQNKVNIVDENGNRIPMYALDGRSDGNYWAFQFKDLPPFGYRSYRIEVLKEDAPNEQKISDVSVMENQFYKISIDKENGTISGIFDKELNKEIVDSNNKWKFGQFINEKLGNRGQMEAYTLTDYTRNSPNSIKVEKGVDCELWQSIIIKGESESTFSPNGIKAEIRLHKNSKLIEMVYTINKKPIQDPEGIYISMPFKMDDFKLEYEVPGGVVQPGKNQLPGSSSEWYTVQNFVSLSNDDAQIIVTSDEAPLMCFGSLIHEKFRRVGGVEKPHLYSWVTNNYWVTNFNAEQTGELSWTYKITSRKSDRYNISEATRFGWNQRVPLLSRVIPAGNEKSGLVSKSLLPELPSNLHLISAKPQPSGQILLQIRETAGKYTKFEIPGFAISETDVNGDEIKENLKFKPYAVKFFKVRKP